MCFGSLVQWVCAWISVKTCNSHSGESDPLRRDMQGREPSICSWPSLGRRVLGFGRGLISLRREFVFHCVVWLTISRRRDWLLFWVEERLAHARQSRLSEIAREGLWFWGTRRLVEALLFWANESLAQARIRRLQWFWRLAQIEGLAIRGGM